MILCSLWASSSIADDETAVAPSILSIIPGQAPPGATVVISGTGINTESSLFLGIEEIPFKVISPRQISFEMPPLPTGNYALYVRQKNGLSSRAYSFAVNAVKPSIHAIQPDTIPLCSAGGSRQITVKGKNFSEGSRVLFDGSMIKSIRITDEEMTFRVPAVPGGLHQIQVRNNDDAVSPAIGLLVVSRPEITGVSQGEDFVTYYELHIDGTNFQQGSAIIVDGKKIQNGQSAPGERDRLSFTDCNRLVYQRYPYDPSIKNFQLTIVNPNGDESSPFSVTAP